MADTQLHDFERELTCSICTEILYQPLTLLDCLHTYCGACLKEWFAFQAASAKTTSSSSSRRLASARNPYTCPSCRETVRGTKADWRLTAHLEGFLKAHPEKARSEEDKATTREGYTPGEDVLPALTAPQSTSGRNDSRDDDLSDSEDERLLAEVRELSMANVDPATAARLQARRERHTRERSHDRRQQSQTQHRHSDRRSPRPSSPTARQVEHQPSLRSLLGGEDIQEEILASIYSEGLLDGIDLENLSPAQEEELTERIAEAYRRRQRQRERERSRQRERNRDRGGDENQSGSEQSAQRQQRAGSRPVSSRRSETRHSDDPASASRREQQRNDPPRLRPAVARPQTTALRTSHARPSRSSTSPVPSDDRQSSSGTATISNTQPRRRANSSSSSTITPPQFRAGTSRTQGTGTARTSRAATASGTPALTGETTSSAALLAPHLVTSSSSPRARSHDPPVARESAITLRPERIAAPLRAESLDTANMGSLRGSSGEGAGNDSHMAVPISETSRSNGQSRGSNNTAVTSAAPEPSPLRAAFSRSDLAPEPIEVDAIPSAIPVGPRSSQSTSLVTSDTSRSLGVATKLPQRICPRCDKPHIETQVHYHCETCSANGKGKSPPDLSSFRPGPSSVSSYDLCQTCYRAGKGCEFWFGFGFVAFERWQRMMNGNSTPATYSASSPQPHVLMARRWVVDASSNLQSQRLLDGAQDNNTALTDAHAFALIDGAFCESCQSHADSCYWYCELCLSGAWGFCNACVLQGRCCTHPLLPLTRMTPSPSSHPPTPSSTFSRPSPGNAMAPYPESMVPRDQPRNLKALNIPHLPPTSYITAPPHIDCDICRLPIPAAAPRFHCYICSAGDYDVCAPCYRAVTSGHHTDITSPSQTSKSPGSSSSAAWDPLNGEYGWRRCPNTTSSSPHQQQPQTSPTTRARTRGPNTTSPSTSTTTGHRLAVIANDAGGRRIVLREKVGGWRMKDNSTSADTPQQPPAPSSLGARHLATWSYFPADPELTPDELAFPRNAEITEVQALNADWSVGVYAGRVGVFPGNHTGRL